jgi:cardiolipin synthase
MALSLSLLIHLGIQLGLIVRILLRRHRTPASRAAWIVVVLSAPVIGILVYLLFGETNIGSKYVKRLRETEKQLDDGKAKAASKPATQSPNLPQRWLPLFDAGSSVNGFSPVPGNSSELMPDSNRSIERMVADIDAARDHVHLIFYIWLPDKNGLKMAEALKRAAARGVNCRALVDDLGSRSLIKSEHWVDMEAAGVKLQRALPIGNVFLRPFYGRIDLRNHRKILIIDNHITYCGSQNCADPEFLPKAKYAPWVDVVLRMEGPIARQNQSIFVTDWMTYADEDISSLVSKPVKKVHNGFAAQVIATGPTHRPSAMPEIFSTLIYSAQRELCITTPYYAPNEELQSALTAAGYRGVDTTIIFPHRNDDFAVAATSRSYYLELLEANVKLFEYTPGLLHSKTMTIDGEITFIGSANMDRRSFELNYENNMLIYDPVVTASLRSRQQEYLEASQSVLLDDVRSWSWQRRLFNNGFAIISPLL